jgi:signal transduction histidine kinase
MTREELVRCLAAHRTIGQAPREELLWIAEHGTYIKLQQGEIVSRHSETVDGLYILLSGRLSIYVKRGAGLRRMMEWNGGDVTGLLPYSRLTNPPGDTVVEDPAELIRIDRSDLPAMIRNCHEVTGILVHVMTDRARRFTLSDLRDEKMRSLGKLTAGFAHEVNNPSSAALRDAKSLIAVLAESDDAACRLLGAGLTPAQLSGIEDIRGICRGPVVLPPLSGLALADREDAVQGWLDAHGMDGNLMEDLSRTTLTTGDLDRLAGVLQGEKLAAALRWISAGAAARALVMNIERASARIHSLVTAARGFTHMDRAADLEPVAVHAGLADTVALLEGKAKGKSVRLELDAPDDIPPVQGYAGEINQVWMNLIDNAIDAAPANGRVAVKAWLEGAEVIVTVTDNGSGIPEDIIGSIFDPFFTTKGVGEGTGLGLDIAQRVVTAHNGTITVESRPGRTEFRVAIPIAGAG